jgi:hypothetical protein
VNKQKGEKSKEITKIKSKSKNYFNFKKQNRFLLMFLINADKSFYGQTGSELPIVYWLASCFNLCCSLAIRG